MKTFFQIVSGLFLLAILSACGGGGGSAGTSMNGAALFTTAADKIQMLYGETKTFTVGGGVPSYSVSSSGAVSAKVSGTTLTIETTATGTGTVTVTDKVGTKVAIDVTVGTGATLSTTAPASVSVGVGAVTSKYFITGGTGVYAVNSSDTSIANVGMSDNIFVIGGVSTGTTTVVVKDNAGQSVSIAVTVVGGARSLFTTAPSAVTVPSGKIVSYSISGGSAPYSVSSNNSGAADATLKQSGTDFDIKAIAAGTANIVVTDASRNSVTIVVTVTTPTAGTLSVLPAGASGSVGDTLKFNVVGGVLPYKVTNTNDSIAKVYVSGDGASFSAALGNVGKSDVTVIDALGTTITISITATGDAATLRLAPNDFEVSEQSSEAYQLKVYGGSPPYVQYWSSDPMFGAVSFSGNTFTIGAVAGRRCVTPPTALGVYTVTLTVVDSLGAMATSKMNVRDTLDATCK